MKLKEVKNLIRLVIFVVFISSVGSLHAKTIEKGGVSYECDGCGGEVTCCWDSSQGVQCEFMEMDCPGSGEGGPNFGPEDNGQLWSPINGSSGASRGGGISSDGVRVSPGMLNFGNIAVGGSASLKGVTLRADRIGLVGVQVATDNPDFLVTTNCGNVALADSCYIWVGFRPSSLGNKIGNLTVTYQYPANQNRYLGWGRQAFPLQGIGLAPNPPQGQPCTAGSVKEYLCHHYPWHTE